MSYRDLLQDYEQLADDLSDHGWIGTDASPVISLFEYDLLYHPDNEIMIFSNGRSVEIGAADTYKFTTMSIGQDDVIDALEHDMEDGYFSFIGSSREKSIREVKENDHGLVHHVFSINQYSGMFQPRRYCLSVDDVRSKFLEGE